MVRHSELVSAMELSPNPPERHSELVSVMQLSPNPSGKALRARIGHRAKLLPFGPLGRHLELGSPWS